MLGRSGCAVALALACGPLLAGEVEPRDYVVHVNEPFYTFATDGATATVTAPDDPDGTSVAVGRATAGGIVQLTGIYRDAPFAIAVTQAPCEDDMAGLPYSHTATVTMGMRTTQGCARLSTEPQPREGG